MLPFDELVLFVMMAVTLAITPGPDNLYVLSQSALYRWQIGVMVTLGLCTGLVIHTMAIALGVTAAILASPWLFDVVRYSGAAYLAFLALQSFQTSQLTFTAQQSPQKTAFQFYRRGILMNLSNPKVALFFLAFLPQFIDLQHGELAVQLIQVGTIFILITLIVFSGYAIMAKPLQRYLVKQPHHQRRFHQFTGIMLLALAIHIAFFSV